LFSPCLQTRDWGVEGSSAAALAMSRYRSSIECTSTWPPQSSAATSSVPYVILQRAFPSSDPKMQSNHNHHTGLACFSFKILLSSYNFFSFAIRNERLNQSTANP
jgi:hypothetical protein